MKAISAREAAELIQDGQTVTVSGLLGNLVPEQILEALEERYRREAAPQGLTEIHPWFYGVPDGSGLNRWAHPGLCARMIGSTSIPPYLSKTAEINALIAEDGVAMHCWPANAIFQMLRAVTAGRSGFLTTVGLGTFVDPRHGGGRWNPSAEEGLVQVVDVAGEEHLFYRALPMDVALIAASTADEAGNLICVEDGLTQGILLQASAARNSGGIVIAEVKEIVPEGTHHPLSVSVPGHLVDYVVVNPLREQWAYGANQGTHPATTGAERAPLPAPQPGPLTPEKVIARRALLEMRRGDLMNMGGGVPTQHMPQLLLEERLADCVTPSVEHGVFGGLCVGATHWNPTAILSPDWLLDFYSGGGIDITFLGFGQADAHGSVNVGRFGDQLPGVGGFTDIATSTRRVVFCGTFRQGGLDAEAGDGWLRILREGARAKFVPTLEMICYSGPRAVAAGHQVRFVTERAVLDLDADGLTVIEIAPGVDLKKDVVDQAGVPLQVSSQLREMDAALFRPEPLGLAQREAFAARG